jgi:hypothetical protein
LEEYQEKIIANEEKHISNKHYLPLINDIFADFFDFAIGFNQNLDLYSYAIWSYLNSRPKRSSLNPCY